MADTPSLRTPCGLPVTAGAQLTQRLTIHCPKRSFSEPSSEVDFEEVTVGQLFTGTWVKFVSAATCHCASCFHRDKPAISHTPSRCWIKCAFPVSRGDHESKASHRLKISAELLGVAVRTILPPCWRPWCVLNDDRLCIRTLRFSRLDFPLPMGHSTP